MTAEELAVGVAGDWRDVGEGPFGTRAEAADFADAECGVPWRVVPGRGGWVVEVNYPPPPPPEVPAGFVRVGDWTVRLPRVGSLVELDGRRVGELLLPCEYPELAPFRFPSWSLKATGGAAGPAVRVDVTGRTAVLRGGERWVRVRVTFVGDGDPDTHAGGWMRAEF